MMWSEQYVQLVNKLKKRLFQIEKNAKHVFPEVEKESKIEAPRNNSHTTALKSTKHLELQKGAFRLTKSSNCRSIDKDSKNQTPLKYSYCFAKIKQADRLKKVLFRSTRFINYR